MAFLWVMNVHTPRLPRLWRLTSATSLWRQTGTVTSIMNHRHQTAALASVWTSWSLVTSRDTCCRLSSRWRHIARWSDCRPASLPWRHDPWLATPSCPSSSVRTQTMVRPSVARRPRLPLTETTKKTRNKPLTKRHPNKSGISQFGYIPW